MASAFSIGLARPFVPSNINQSIEQFSRPKPAFYRLPDLPLECLPEKSQSYDSECGTRIQYR